MQWYWKVMADFENFSGRSRRKEYWTFYLINFGIAFVLGFIDGLIGTLHAETGIGLLGGIYTLIVLVPGLAVGVRRLHDVGKSGWWLLISLIPFIGAIWLIVLFATDSQPGPNRYGDNPKEVSPAFSDRPDIIDL